MSTTITRRLIGLESGRYIMDLRELVAELSDLPPHAYIEDARIAGSKIAISVRVPALTADDVPLLEQLLDESSRVQPQ